MLNQVKYDQMVKDCGKDALNRPGCKEDAISTLKMRNTMVGVLGVTAGVVAVSAIVLFFVEGAPRQSRIQVAPMAGNINGLLARVEF